jgi:Uncharacterized proteins, homologs of microcin C7 resistance protein MccF
MKDFNYLKEGGKIALIAPSFGCTTEPYKTRLDVAIKNFKELGYSVYEGENIYKNIANARSNSAKKCAHEFMSAYLSDNDVIISVGGGELMCEILPYIDFGMIKISEPKIFMGFSDNTNLTYTLTTIADIPTIYGPNAPSFAFKPFKYSTLDALNLLTNKVKETRGYPFWQRYPDKEEIKINPLAESKYNEPKIIKVYPRNSIINLNGRLIGGCLDCLTNLCGTKFDKTKEFLEKYKKDGFIWFLESCDLNSIGIERALFQLKEAGWFKYAKGFIFGRPFIFKERLFGINHYKAIKNVIEDLKIPYCVDADLGHYDPSMPIITGLIGNVIVKDNNITIKYQF